MRACIHVCVCQAPPLCRKGCQVPALEFQAGVNCSGWVLGSKSRSSARAAVVLMAEPASLQPAWFLFRAFPLSSALTSTYTFPSGLVCLLLHLLYMSECLICVLVYQKRAWNPLELKLQMVIAPSWCWEQNLGPPQGQ